MQYLQNMGVAVLLINEVETITGNFRATRWDRDYIADNIVFLRYTWRCRGEIKSDGVLKKQMTDFETLLEFEIATASK